jgi:peptide/nickel transport system permease protein
MSTFVIRRLIIAVVVLLIVTLLVFFAMRLLPGDPIYMILSAGQLNNLNEEQIQEMRHQYGLDRPLIGQYLSWLSKAVRGDLGMSISTGQPVTREMTSRVPITLNLGLIAFVISFTIGIALGSICAIRRGTWIDTVLTIFANIGVTIPVFWLGLVLIYIFALGLHWLPVQGYISPFSDFSRHIRLMIMPVFCLCVFSLAAMTRQSRSSMLEILRMDYIRTAWSKGVRERVVVMKHALKNSLIPVIALAGIQLSYIIGGSVLIETVFNIPGMGRATVSAVLTHDYPIVQGFILLIAISVLTVNMIVDVSYGWLDPRIRYG